MNKILAAIEHKVVNKFSRMEAAGKALDHIGVNNVIDYMAFSTGQLLSTIQKYAMQEYCLLPPPKGDRKPVADGSVLSPDIEVEITEASASGLKNTSLLGSGPLGIYVEEELCAD